MKLKTIIGLFILIGFQNQLVARRIRTSCSFTYLMGYIEVCDEYGNHIPNAIVWKIVNQDSTLLNRGNGSRDTGADRYKFEIKMYQSDKAFKPVLRVKCEGFADVLIYCFDAERRQKPTYRIVLYKKKFIQKDGYFIKYDLYEFDLSKDTSVSLVIDMALYTKKLMQESSDATYERILKSKYQSYPNPVQDKMTIEVKDSMPRPFKVRVYDLMGEVVLEEELTEAKMQIDLSATAAGTFFVRIDDDQGEMKHYMKFVKT